MLKVGIFIFENIETLDFCGPLEVFSAANFVSENELFDVFTFAKNQIPVSTINGLSVNPTFDFHNIPQPEILIIPGGEGSKSVLEDKTSMDFLEKIHTNCKHTLTVCTGARIAANLGWLRHMKFTTHHSAYEEITQTEPTATPVKTSRFTDNGKILTAGGVSAGLDLSFHLLEKICGKQVAEKTQEYMEYQPRFE